MWLEKAIVVQGEHLPLCCSAGPAPSPATPITPPACTCNAHKGAHGAAGHGGQPSGSGAERLVGGVQQQALLRVHRERLGAQHAKDLGVKGLHRRQEDAKL